jgi:lipopolysaccharide/colanic/teichoic acid biosynthesis glycosyltransferase
MAICALAIRIADGPPVLYRQERMGLDGRSFRMLKFRTMRRDAEAVTGPRWAEKDDPRAFAVGRVLRRLSLDELPQLFNVIRGDMSVVGPRPERPALIQEFKRKIPRYMLRHAVKAGITGWAQVNGWRGNTSLKKRIQYDLYYIENWSVLFDLKIMALTFVRGFYHPNAY